jgi:hypothetical protein
MQNIAKKIIPYLLILIALIGLFGLVEKADAQTYKGTCYDIGTRGIFNGSNYTRKFEDVASEDCTYEKMVLKDNTVREKDNFVWQSTKEPTKAAQGALNAAANQSQFVAAIDELECGWDGIMPGCLIKGFYYLLYVLPAYLLTQAAYFFNVIISVTLNGTVFKQDFVPTAWGVVRDLSNIFFILILLYIAVKIILDMGGHEAKQMIAKVVVIALLINFSMFFTQVIIDASNVLALVFYNKVSVTTKVAGQTGERPYASVGGEKDVAGGRVAAFDPTTTLKQDFFTEVKKNYGPSGEQLSPSPTVPWGTLLALILIAGLIMCFAIYALMVTGLSFLGRLIELWVLIIFSPFAFMSSTVPLLSGVEYLGWSSWFKRLLKVSFMAPIFMFFLYFIFMLIDSNVFTTLIPRSVGESTPATVIKMILGVVMPTLLILTLLLKATEIAKKSSGVFGEGVMTAAKVATGLALGVATGGAALVGRNTLGWSTAKISRTEGAKNYGKVSIEHNKALEKWEHAGKNGPKPKFRDTLREYEEKNKIKINTKNPFTALGGRINAIQARSGEVDHARHEMDEIKKKAGLENVGDRFLSGVEEQKLESTFIKERRSEIEAELRRGYNAKGEKVSIEGNGVTATGESDYKAQRRQAIIDEESLGGEELSDEAKKKVEDKLNSEFNEILRETAATIGKKKYEHLKDEAREKVGMATRIAARSTGGTYDVRNISGLKTDKREGLGAKATIGIISAIALGMRMGLKKTAGVDVGTPQGNFLKDIGQTVTEALKNVKIDVKLGDGGGGAHGPAAHAHAPVEDHGGGHGGGHH